MMTSVKAFYKNGEIIFNEKPNNILFSNVIVTFIDETMPTNENLQAMKLSEHSFSEWNNTEDEIYDNL